MKIAIIGAGYVGLTTGACLAELGNTVTCHDLDSARIASLRQSECPIFEPGLQELLSSNINAERLQFTTGIADATTGSEVVFLAVNTPSDHTGHVDLSFVFRAVRSIAPFLERGSTLVVKSTVTAGTADRIEEVLHHDLGRPDVRVASNPEFLREGSAISDFLFPDRIVIGTNDPVSSERLSALFEPLTRKNVPLVVTERVNAEMIKYAANAFLALKIGFINNVADLCESVGGRVDDVAYGIGLDLRIGSAFLKPGPGFGGSCFPKDTRAFAACGRSSSAPQPLVETLIRENEERKLRLAGRIVSALEPLPHGARVAVLGTAFKANTDDMREAAALTIVPFLQHAGIRVSAHDPQARSAAQALFAGVEWHDAPLEAARDADAVVILTEWESYRQLDLGELSRRMRGRHLFDYRNLFDAETANRHGLHYTCLGRAPAYLSVDASQPAMMSAAAE
jgi:UDPglucose 6-dehydrogenase